MDKEFGDPVIKLIVIFMKDSMFKIRNMVEVYTDGQMELYIKVLLRMI